MQPSRRSLKRAATVHSIASAVGATDVVELEKPVVNLQNAHSSGSPWNGVALLLIRGSRSLPFVYGDITSRGHDKRPVGAEIRFFGVRAVWASPYSFRAELSCATARRVMKTTGNSQSAGATAAQRSASPSSPP